jgi:hypothetical protein
VALTGRCTRRSHGAGYEPRRRGHAAFFFLAAPAFLPCSLLRLRNYVSECVGALDESSPSLRIKLLPSYPAEPHGEIVQLL